MSSTAPIALADRTTWAKRNPTAKVQASREPARKLTDAEKATRKLAAGQKKKAQAALNADINAYLLERAEKLEALAADHNVKVKKIKNMVNSETHYKKPRAPTLQNAIVHFMAKKINDDLPVGERKTLAELKEMARDDPEVQSFTKADEENLVTELTEYRALKKTGVRASNKAASRDILLTLDRVIDELDCLADRTGFSTFILGARNSVNDEAPPTFHGSGDSMEFFPEVLERDPWELARLFEQWLCKREKNIVERDTIAKLRMQSTGMIKIGLRNITNVKKIEMNYANYNTAIVQVHGVKLAGFPLERFVNPSEVTNITDMRRLRNALRSGECKWVRLSQAELDAHAEDLEARRKDGEVVGKPRKKRSDAGVLRGKRKRVDMDGDKENQGTAPKKKKTSQSLDQRKSKAASQRPKMYAMMSKQPKSREFVDEDEDSTDDDTDTDDDN